MLELSTTLLYILFVLAAIVLVVVVLLQEGRGGGLTEALGQSGQQTFGVGASGINRFTGATAAVFLGSALLIHVLNRHSIGESVLKGLPAPASSSIPGGGAGQPGGAVGGQAPPVQAPVGQGPAPVGPPAPPDDGSPTQPPK